MGRGNGSSMGISFSGSDIIDIAIHIEKNGVEFYKYALSAVKQADLQDCFRRLADMEQKHISVFQELCDICHEKCVHCR
jgi:rubrerythrin